MGFTCFLFVLLKTGIRLLEIIFLTKNPKNTIQTLVKMFSFHFYSTITYYSKTKKFIKFEFHTVCKHLYKYIYINKYIKRENKYMYKVTLENNKKKIAKTM